MQLPAHSATLMHVFILLQTQRSKIDNDNEGAASDGEPDLQGKDLSGRAKGKPVARKVQPLSSCPHIYDCLL